MIKAQGKNNEIDPSASICADIEIGSWNRIGKGVVISSSEESYGNRLFLGDCNTINDNTRILVGPQGIQIGDWNVFHNNMLFLGEQQMRIGSNCWFGQNTILDSTGGLKIGNGVRVGMYSQIWTHVASGELIEGCTLFAKNATTIEDEVWLVGSCFVGSGLHLGYRSICMSGSNITKDTEEGGVYGGVPAKRLEKLNFYKEVTLLQKMEFMKQWAEEFALSDSQLEIQCDSQEEISILNKISGEKVQIVGHLPKKTEVTTTYFEVASKRYTKRLSRLEVDFYRSIFGNRARFLPF
ncbi:MAG: hypothetical protein A2Z96_07975 [Spirochaetes bacterium GWB1_48_6]|nr:MAG: hypothetical protein A2Z96_07975 [Spirochaetes bacterium GWB1_48_6]